MDKRTKWILKPSMRAAIQSVFEDQEFTLKDYAMEAHINPSTAELFVQGIGIDPGSFEELCKLFDLAPSVVVADSNEAEGLTADAWVLLLKELTHPAGGISLTILETLNSAFAKLNKEGHAVLFLRYEMRMKFSEVTAYLQKEKGQTFSDGLIRTYTSRALENLESSLAHPSAKQDESTLTLDIQVNNSSPTDEVAVELATLCKALNAYHIA